MDGASLPPPWPWLLTSLTLWCGLVTGGFLTVLVPRLRAAPGQRGLAAWRAVARDGSGCDGCGRRLRWPEKLPLLGYALTRGRCPACGYRVPAALLLMELAGLASGGSVALLPGASILDPLMACLLVLAPGLGLAGRPSAAAWILVVALLGLASRFG